MGAWRTAGVLGIGLLGLPVTAAAHRPPYWEDPGSLVSVSVEVDGRDGPLYPAPDGSGRYYLEAREGGSYTVRLANRTHERVAVALIVDGLNAISGERAEPGSSANRMYVLGPWDETSVRGWRTSLREVRRFTFVDERASYAARSGKANRKMGWIEVAVFRERRPYVVGSPRWEPGDELDERESAEGGVVGGRPAAPPATSAPEVRGESKAPDRASDALRSLGYLGERPRESYPGTGWGGRSYDPVVVVDFHPEPHPAEIVTLRYEYAPALRALGVYPRPHWDGDRLRERERGGFAKPPAW